MTTKIHHMAATASEGGWALTAVPQDPVFFQQRSKILGPQELIWDIIETSLDL